ncbi:MAG: hypothetical protein IJI27_10010 [Oscillospiraceae bacterium]|nr:hypothetical protein [Oscillospiraceae bacterium]
MADNPYTNKVVYAGQTLIDLTGDTATAADVAQGKTFHLPSGAQAIGTAISFKPQIIVTAPTGSTVTATDGTTILTAAESGGTWIFDIPNYGTWTVTATLGAATASGTVSITEVKQYTMTLAYFAATLNITAPSGSTVTVTKDGATVNTHTATGSAVAVSVHEPGTYDITATSGSESASDTASITTDGQSVSVTLAFVNIYGVTWDGTATQSLTRTDAAAGFSDPVPYVAGASTYGSPFDDLSPWKDIVRVTDAEAGEMVKIPKFYYKLTQSGSTISVQIADSAADGFSVCPACMDRGDGKGERDYVLVGRYHCANSTYKSTSGVKPQVSLQQSTFRTNIHNLGSNVYMMDFATRFTIWLLYIVEFANWDSQKTIGKGCGNNSAVENMGYTDSMPYHTGTTLSSRDTYGVSTQYRYMEGLWDNCYDRLTGCYNASSGLMVEVNPANFAENSGGVSVGTPASGWIAGLTVSTSGPFPCFINSNTSGGGENAYVGDYWSFNASSPVVCVGGNYSQSGNRGMFCVNYTSLTDTGDNRGSRVFKLT